MPVISTTWEAEIGRIRVQVQPRKIVRPHLNQQVGVMVYFCDASYKRGSCRRMRP
jgi:hypothetical protein